MVDGCTDHIPAKDREHFDVDRGGFIKPTKLCLEADPWHRIVKCPRSDCWRFTQPY